MKNILALLLTCTIALAHAQSYLQPVPASDSRLTERSWYPTSYAAWHIDLPAVASIIDHAPMEFTAEARQNNPAIIALPQPDGSVEAYAVYKVMACEQAVYDKYPEIRTFAGYALQHPGHTIRGSITVRGLRVRMVGTDRSVAWMEPFTDGQTEYYISYQSRDIPESLRPKGLTKGIIDNAGLPQVSPLTPGTPVVAQRAANDPIELKTYRFAPSCTGEFGQDHGGTPASAFAAVVEYSNWLSSIFEQDISLRLQMVAGCDQMAFSNPATDPFPNIDPLALLETNPLVVNGFIGINNYDIGHVYSRYPGGSILGVAGAIGNACVLAAKAQGCTTGFQGVYGDDFTNTLGQEVGHQLGGGHTWNRCGQIGGRNGQSAFEPGSGSTIMSYAGSCGSDNVQTSSDLYFHAGSIEEIQNYFTLYYGSTCGSFTLTDNHRPEVTLSYTNDFFIPILTPFELNGSATDADGDVLTYCWEQMNTGPETPLNTPVGTSPIFRTYPPSAQSNRYFPKLSNILSNTFSLTEQLPTYSRDLDFRLTARDSRPTAGGSGWADVAFRATEQAGPFLVQTANTVGSAWTIGSYVNVQWDVANTYNAPVNCKHVNIRLSTDGGLTWPHTLAAGVANDGQHTVQVPNLPANNARLRIDAADNIFFDISDASFTIAAPTQPTVSVGMSENFGDVCLPGVFSSQILTAPALGYNQPVSLSILSGDLPAGATISLGQTTVSPGQSTSLTVDLQEVTAPGEFVFQVKASAPGISDMVIDVRIIARRNDFSTMGLQAPADGSTNLSQSQVLRWTKATDAETYDLQLANSASFAPGTIIATKTNTPLDTFKIPFLLEKGKAYFWRIRPNNICSPHPWTAPFFFSTQAENCATYGAWDLPKTILSGSANSITSKIELTGAATVTDVNISKIKGFHGFFSDLEAKLIAPSGAEVLLFKNKCNNYNGAFVLGLDDSAPNPFACITSGTFVRPQNPLAALIGEQAQGEWKLQIRDLVAGSGGVLEEFTLDVCQSAQVSPPYIVQNNTLALNSGANALITNGLLLAEDADNTASQLTYTLLSVPEHGLLIIDGQPALEQGAQFTQQDINEGSLRYFNYGNGAVYDTFRFMVSDGTGGYAGNLQYEIEVITGIQDASGDLPDFSIFPNPAQDAFFVSLSGQAPDAIPLVLYTLAGQAVRTHTIARGQTRTRIETADLPPGLYLLQAATKQGVANKKIIIK